MPARRLPDPPDLPLLVTRDEALAAGLTDDQVRHRVRSGTWAVVATATYLRDPSLLNSPDAHHVWRAVGAARRVEGSVIVGASAALVHGLPLVSPLPPKVELAVPASAWRGVRGDVRRRAIDIDPVDVTEVQLATTSAPVTTVSRTWIDVAREESLADALSVGDAALRRDQFTLNDVAVALDRTRELRGIKHAIRAAGHLNGARESPFESWSYADFIEWGLPLPELQVIIRDDAGYPVGRVDFLWREQRVIGEADGLLKYADDRGVAAFGREKDREAALRDLGFEIVRWRWADLARRPALVRQRIERALQRGANRAA